MTNKKITALFAAAALAAVVALAGCSGSQSSSNAPAASNNASSPAASAPAAAPAAESTAAATSAPAAAPAAAPAQQAPAQDSYISMDEAKAAALQHAGIAEADTTELKVELDTDDAVVHFDVDFKSGGKEYDYDIDAVTGEVLRADSEIDD